MSRRVWYGWLLAAGMLLAACGQAGTPTLPSEEKEPSLLPNLLVSAEGNVWLRRPGWSDFLPAGFGVSVAPGDLLRVEPGGLAAIFCGAQALWADGPQDLQADGAEHGIPCQSGHPPRPWPDVGALRGETRDAIPYVIGPRDSAVLDDTPLLRWRSIPGVETYTVSILSDDGHGRLPAEVSGGEMSWPDDWMPLVENATYVLVVEGGGHQSDESNKTHAGLGFWLLGAPEAEGVRDQENLIRSRPLSVQAADLLVAELYLGSALRAEATYLLEGLGTQDGQPSVWLALGRVYLGSGLAWEAGEAFEKARTAAQASGEKEMEAAAQVGLGLAAGLKGDEASSIEYLRVAESLYELIGDRQKLEELGDLLPE